MPSPNDPRAQLAAALQAPSAFPWQLALLERMLAGDLPRALDIPTGLGKTAVIAIWLIARAAGAPLPRRLVYVVDRRAVVDQATQVAETLRAFVEKDPALKTALGLETPLPISTLRGKFIDNRAWLTDPSAPAIVLGTIDMIGSRLLFEGYGVSPRMRPYHAGLLGADTLVVLDEAHLVPPFERLLESIAAAPDRGGDPSDRAATSPFAPTAPELAALIPRLHLMALSATGRHQHDTLALGDDDRAHPIVARRLAATKRLVIRDQVSTRDLPARLADEAWAVSSNGAKPIRCIVFCNLRDHAQDVHDLLRKRAPANAIDVELFVGARRIWEREDAARWLEKRGFLAGTESAPDKPAFVIATSAGEVGIDLDADHMVSDLVAWERMVQRLGRVNRRGDGDAHVIVIPAESDEETIAARLAATQAVLAELPRIDAEGLDASPGALTELRARTRSDERLRDEVERASSPDPLHPPLSRPLVDAWSLTSMESHTGRPDITPWLRGWIEEEAPQTTIVWREHLPLDASGDFLGERELALFRDAADPHLAERLETETRRAADWLAARLTAATKATKSGNETDEADETNEADEPTPRNHTALRPDDIVALLLDGSRRSPRRLCARDIATKEKRAELEEDLAGALLLVDRRLGGLSQGLLDEDQDDLADDVTMLRLDDGAPAVPFRVRRATDDANERDPDWRSEARIAIAHTADGNESAWLVIESHRSAAAESEDGRSVGAKRAQELDEHEEWAERAARRIAAALALPAPYVGMLALAARLHDEGKRSKRWQQAFRAPPDGKVYGKTITRPNLQLLGRYRHELGSLPYAQRDPRVRDLDPELQALLLHLIAAHHGNARPLLRTDGADEPPSVLEARAQDIALRFFRQQKRWGPWGLAWWEALLRAADQQASRQNDEGGTSHG